MTPAACISVGSWQGVTMQLRVYAEYMRPLSLPSYSSFTCSSGWLAQAVAKHAFHVQGMPCASSLTCSMLCFCPSLPLLTLNAPNHSVPRSPALG